MCLAPDGDDDDSRHARDVIDAADEVFVRAPPSCARHPMPQVADAVQAWVDGLRAEAGRRPLSADMYRRRRALAHQSVAIEFAERRKVEVGLALEEDELCRSVMAAMGTQMLGSCAYCGCNFSVVAAEDVPGGFGMVCGVCGRRVRVYDDPAPMVPDPPENAEGRWKGWLPW